MRISLAALALAALVAAPAAAQDGLRQITVTGTGTVEAAPDMALVRVGVTGEAATAREAVDRIAEAADAVLARLGQAGVAPRDMQTSELSLGPIWSQPPEKDNAPERRITGFAAETSVTVRLRDLDRLGEVLDAVVSDGANQFGGLQFTLQDPDAAQAEARARAVRDAMDRAAALAEAAGVTLGEVQSISDQTGGRPYPMEMAAMARDSGGFVPVAPGEISLEAQVTMVFAIAR